jgi:predicted phage terminase large subunit-like protein
VSSAVEALDYRAAARELLRRRLCQDSFKHFVLYNDIPGCPPALAPDVDTLEMLGGPDALLADHHALICEKIQETMETPFGRLMIMAPPGSAKSSYASVAAPAWAMGKWPNEPIILTSYASGLAERQSIRAQQICATEEYRLLWDQLPKLEKDSVKHWTLSNGSSLFAAGLTAGITGARAMGAIVDDPVAGREEADSPTMRQKVIDAYQDDLLTRLKPGAWLIFIMTRWHELDLAGSILPDTYAGETGWVKCKDGLDWYVINIQAKAERNDDPLGRKPGEYLWPEYLTPKHWQMYELAETREAQRRWASLYQQRPTPFGAGTFTPDMFNWYGPGELPPQLALVGGSDFAVTEAGGDFTEHGLAGVDHQGQLWFIDWWSGQKTTDVSIDAFLDMVDNHKVPYWFNEAGVIDKAVRPAINKRMRERNIYTVLQSLPSNKDKVSKVQSFQARAASGSVWLPKGKPWAHDLVAQLCALPAGRHDDKADVAGLIGRAIDKVPNATLPEPPKPRGIKPFSAAWLEYQETDEKPAVRYR